MSEIQAVPGAAESGHNEQIWRDMKDGDTGSPVDALPWGMAAFQITGGSRAGAVVMIEARLNGSAEFISLPDDEGFACRAVENKIVQVSRLCVAQIRPRLVGGIADTNVTVSVLLKR